MSHDAPHTTTAIRDTKPGHVEHAGINDSGRVKLGGTGIKFSGPATKDAGRVRLGGTGIKFR